MSQHYVHTTTADTAATPVMVFVGWDRIAGGYFMDVMYGNRFSTQKNNDGYLYEGIEDDATHAGYCDSLDYFKSILAGLSIELPGELFARLEFDRDNNIGNALFTYYVEDGALVTVESSGQTGEVSQ